MIVWSGKGFLLALVLIVSVFAFIFMLPEAFSEKYTFSIAFLISAIFSWFMGKKWDSEEGRIFIDQQTGQEILFKPSHTLFWIKAKYWAYIFGVLALVTLLKNFI